MTNNYISVLKIALKVLIDTCIVMDLYITIKKSITLQVSMNTFRAHFKITNIITGASESNQLLPLTHYHNSDPPR